MMRSPKSTRATACAALLMLFAGTSSAWECSIALNAPKAIGIGETKTLYASGTPEGGSYSWSNTPGLSASGDIATLLGFQPSYSDYISTRVTYTAPRGNRCSASKYIWVYDCDIRLSGPADMLVDDTATLIAKTYSHDPTGGVYTWSGPDDLLNLGGAATADFTPLLPGEAVITADYTEGQDPDICTSTASHTINVWPDCQLDIQGLDELPLGDTVSLRGVATPNGGSFTWDNVTTVVPSTGNLFAYFEGTAPGNHTVAANYTTAEGYACKDPATHDIEVYKVASISGPVCANSGDVLTAGDYAIVTDPAGHEGKATVYPELLRVRSLTSETETLSINASVTDITHLDNASTGITVVNLAKSNELDVSVAIPNYLNEALSQMGVSERLDFALKSSFSTSNLCCQGAYVAEKTKGATTLALAVDAKLFKLFGVPFSSRAEKWVKLDLLTITASASGTASIEGQNEPCLGATNWKGHGSLSASLMIGGEIEAKVPSGVVVVSGKLQGETKVKEDLAVVNSELLLTGSWNGVQLAASYLVRIAKFGTVADSYQVDVLAPRETSKVRVPLPSL